jgi:hypothetical protein
MGIRDALFQSVLKNAHHFKTAFIQPTAAQVAAAEGVAVLIRRALFIGGLAMVIRGRCKGWPAFCPCTTNMRTTCQVRRAHNNLP